MKRSDTWATFEIPAYLQAMEKKAFVWGRNDCCLFAANAIEQMTEVDIASDFRDKYTDQESAMATIRNVTGGSTIEDALVYVADKHALPEWLMPDGSACPLKAQRGDLCAVSNNGSIIAGIVETSGRYVACMSDKGYLRLPLSAIKRAWHV